MLDGTQLWLVSIDDPAMAQVAWRLLDDAERQRAARFALAHLGQRYAACRGALRLLLGAALDQDARAVRLVQEPSGKPRLVDGPGLAFNVSHCDGTALIALAAGCDVGVDVEAPRHVREPQRVAHRMFARSEAKVIAELGPELAAAAFLRCWTAKEAVLKALGIGLAGRLDEVVVDAHPHVPLRLRRVPGPRLASDWTLHAVELPQGLVGALALAAPALPAVAVRRFTADEAARRL